MPKLTLSRSAINEAIMQFEVSWSKESGFNYYNKKYKFPIVPAPSTTSSGVTIGLGYDCGYNSRAEIIKDWSSVLPQNQVIALANCAGKKSWVAVEALKQLPKIEVPIEAALQVFYNTTIYKFAKFAYNVYPNIVNLHPVEQTVLVGLVYNRGNDLSGDRRREMKALVQAVKNDNDKEMANLIRSMKRLWLNVRGLRIRRDVEAAMIERLDVELPNEDLLTIEW